MKAILLQTGMDGIGHPNERRLVAPRDEAQHESIMKIKTTYFPMYLSAWPGTSMPVTCVLFSFKFIYDNTFVLSWNDMYNNVLNPEGEMNVRNHLQKDWKSLTLATSFPY